MIFLKDLPEVTSKRGYGGSGTSIIECILELNASFPSVLTARVSLLQLQICLSYTNHNVKLAHINSVVRGTILLYLEKEFEFYFPVSVITTYTIRPMY